MSKRNPGTLGKWGNHLEGGTRVLAVPAMWKAPLKWNTEAQLERIIFEAIERGPQSYQALDAVFPDKLDARIRSMVDRKVIQMNRETWKWEPLRWANPRVFNASLADWAEKWNGPISHIDGQVWMKPYLDSESYRSNWVLESIDFNAKVQDWQGWRLVEMSDVRKELFALIDATPYLDWLMLTKRPENIRKFWPCIGFPNAGVPGTLGRHLWLQNAWLGTTVENQNYIGRVDELLKCSDLASVLFLSIEPMLGPVELPLCFHSIDDPNQTDHSECAPIIQWVICGAEQGPQNKPLRPMAPDWARSLRDQCQAAGVPFFMKQMEVGGKITDDVSLFPKDLQVREWPIPRTVALQPRQQTLPARG